MYVTLAYAFLIGYALTELFNRFTSHFKKMRSRERQIISGIPIVFALFLIVGVYAFPLWTGDVIRPGTRVLQSSRYKMPAYYQDASDWLETDASDFKVITLPVSKIGYAELKWDNGGYDGPYPAEWLFPQSIITSALAGNGLAGQTIDLITKNSTKAAAKLLALMNVKYVLFHEDSNWLYVEDNPSWISTSREQLQSILSASNTLFLEKKLGELDFYRNEYWSPMHIYARTNSILINGGLNQMIQFTELTDFDPSESVLLLSDQLDIQQISTLPMNIHSKGNVSAIFEEIDPTRYIVQVNASQPFFLVFSESYDKDWIAYVDGQQIPNEYHFTANGFANGWYINKTGTYTITLEFWPQKLFYIGSAISITTFILCTIYVSKDKIKTTYKRYVKKNQQTPFT
jgi:hypothetical protein